MFGERIRQLRKEKGLTLKELSSKLGISFTALGNYERGDRKPNLEMLDNLANYFDVSIDYLMGKTEIRTFDENVVYGHLKAFLDEIKNGNPTHRDLAAEILELVYFITLWPLRAEDTDELETIKNIMLVIFEIQNEFPGHNSPSRELNQFELTNFFINEKQKLDEQLLKLLQINTKKRG